MYKVPDLSLHCTPFRSKQCMPVPHVSPNEGYQESIICRTRTGSLFFFVYKTFDCLHDLYSITFLHYKRWQL